MKIVETIDSLESKQSIKPPEKSRKLKILKILGIIFATLVILGVVFILVAKYKYNFFKKNEIYEVASIKRDLGSTEYFTETKTMNSKLSFTNGEIKESEQIIDSKFVVMIADRKDLEDDDYIDTAALIILDSKLKMEGKEADLESLNIFDDEVLQKIEENQEGIKYPIALFHFYKNGTLKDINVHENSTKVDIDNMEELINNVIPKLSRNKTEDEKYNIKITKRYNNQKASFTEYKPIREYVDKFSNRRIEGSKITKTVERDVDNEKLTEVRAETNIYLETQKKGEENNTNNTYLDFGLENLFFDASSQIMAYEMNETIDDKNIIKHIISKLSFQNSEELMKILLEKEKEEQEEKLKNITEQSEKTLDTNNRLRNLFGFGGTFSYNWNILEFNVLGIWVTGSYYINYGGGTLSNLLKFESGSSVLKLGNVDGLDYTGYGYSNSAELGILIPIYGPICLSLKIGGDFSYGLNFENYGFTIKLGGSAYASAGLELNLFKVARAGAGVRGSLLSAEFLTQIGINSNGRFYKKNIELRATSGRVEIYAEGYVLWFKIFDFRVEIWRGWTRTWNW